MYNPYLCHIFPLPTIVLENQTLRIWLLVNDFFYSMSMFSSYTRTTTFINHFEMNLFSVFFIHNNYNLFFILLTWICSVFFITQELQPFFILLRWINSVFCHNTRTTTFFSSFWDEILTYFLYQQKGEEEDIDIDLTDPEVNKAAIKIQSTFRGHMSRKGHW